MYKNKIKHVTLLLLTVNVKFKAYARVSSVTIVWLIINILISLQLIINLF